MASDDVIMNARRIHHGAAKNNLCNHEKNCGDDAAQQKISIHLRKIKSRYSDAIYEAAILHIGFIRHQWAQ